MSGFREHKRFVAGAVCPHCGAQDSVRLWRNEAQREQRDCVACGWQETLDEATDQQPVRLLNP